MAGSSQGLPIREQDGKLSLSCISPRWRHSLPRGVTVQVVIVPDEATYYDEFLPEINGLLADALHMTPSQPGAGRRRKVEVADAADTCGGQQQHQQQQQLIQPKLSASSRSKLKLYHAKTLVATTFVWVLDCVSNHMLLPPAVELRYCGD